MGKQRLRIIFGSLAACVGMLCLAPAAHAASTWVFSGQTNPNGTAVKDANGEPLAVTSYTGSDANLTIAGAYAANGSGNTGFASGATWTTTGVNSNPLYWSGNGLGMCSDPDNTTAPKCDQPNHALDNNGNTEGILLQFSSSIVLTSVGIGYISGDADISVFRYDGLVAPTLGGISATKADMATAGWKLVGNYNTGSDEDAPFNLINGAKADGTAGTNSVGSSWWLITAYNTSYSTGTNSALDKGNDYFKLYAVAGETCTAGRDCGKKVSEPGSVALAGMALLGLIYTRRQAKRKI